MHPPQRILISNLTGTVFSSGVIPDSTYWRRHARESVRFEQGTVAIATNDCNLLLEIGPHPVLGRMAVQCWPHETVPPVIGSLQRNVENTLIEAITQLQAAGVNFVSLPTELAEKLASQNKGSYVEPSTPEEKMLCDISREILNVEKVSVTDNFSALGIDSLLSLKLIFKLKSKGLKEDLIKEILSGDSIREIAARISSNSKPALTTEKKQKNRNRQQVINTTEAVNAFRGIAICFVILNHWIEGFLNKLISSQEMVTQLTPLLRFPGTPHFAIAFGLFLSYLYSDSFRKGNFSKGFQIIQTRIIVILIVIFLVTLPGYIKIFFIGDFSPLAFIKATYGIMNYYFLAMLTIPFLMYLFLGTQWAIGKAIALSAISMGIAVYLLNFSEWPFWQEGWMFFVKLNLLGHYGYFNLLSFSLLGVAAGLFLKTFRYESWQFYTVFTISLIALLSSVLLGGYDYSVEHFYFPQLFFHAGIALLLVLGLLMIGQIKGYMGRFFLAIRNVFSVLGILTLPLFVLHGYVIPAKDLLIYFGLQNGLALAIPFIIFFFVVGWLAKIIYRTKIAI